MKKLVLPLLLLFALLCGCGQASPEWQEQYDLGVRYLSEGNYEEAVLAFEAAIEIEPRRAEAYVGAARAAMALGDAGAAADFLARGQEAAGESELFDDAWAELGLTPPAGGPGGASAGVNDLSFVGMTPEEITAALPSLVQPEPDTERRAEDADGSWSVSTYDASGALIRQIGYNPDGTEHHRLEKYVDRDGATLEVNYLSIDEVYPGGVQYRVRAERNREILFYSDSSAGFGELRQSLETYDYAGAQVTLTRRDTSEDFDCTSSVTYTMASPDNEIQLWSSLTDTDNSSYDYIVICESGPQLPEGRFSAYHGDGTPYPEFDLSQYRR